eukprot:GHVU01098916.1.p1 GENE.GHVU01098916.1~~GHVU01098916.1.p1  ORF type:complete len:268 (-),score=37.06 GHVU01098916.1:147-854(-)
MTAAYPAALSDDGDTDSECQLTPITGESQRRDSADEYPSDSVLDEESQPHPDIPVVSLSRGNKRLNADVVKLGSKGTSGLLASIGDILEQRATTVDSELRKIYEKADKDIGVLVQRTLERQRRRRDEEAARARSDMSNLKDRIGRKQEALTNVRIMGLLAYESWLIVLSSRLLMSCARSCRLRGGQRITLPRMGPTSGPWTRSLRARKGSATKTKRSSKRSCPEDWSRCVRRQMQ